MRLCSAPLGAPACARKAPLRAARRAVQHRRLGAATCRAADRPALAEALPLTDADTIAAIVTPVVPQGSGVAIVRISGDDAVRIAQRLFRPGRPAARDSKLSAPSWVAECHRVHYGCVYDDDSRLVDEVLLLPMLKPRSYTREDVVELHCHGGSVCVQRVLSLCLRAGARLASPGEFTMRAFMNGRLDLLQAESVQAIIDAQTKEAADSALLALRGGLSKSVESVRTACVDLIAELEARLDFEDELPSLNHESVAERAAKLQQEVADILQAARRGCLLSTGVQVAIIGRPNVGKSSLLNAWSRSERAIVTAQPGTTRDIVEARVAVCGVPITLLDTAGIHAATDSVVEQIGIERSKLAALGADLVIMVIDGEAGWSAEEESIMAALAPSKSRPLPLLVVNKADRAPNAAQALPDGVVARFAAVSTTSAARGEGIAQLEEAVADVLGVSRTAPEGAAWAANQRQAEALELARAALIRLEETVRQDLPVDFWTIELREAALALGLVTGADVSDDVLATIFARFCIGNKVLPRFCESFEQALGQHAMEGQRTCQTAPNVVFESVDELKAHYKSDWHRYNLKRKVVGLPMVGRELFERVVSHACNAGEDDERAANTAHLKADKQRRRPRKVSLRDFDDDDESADEWEEVHGDEAEAALAQLATRRGARAQQEEPLAEAEASDADMHEADDAAGAPHVALAGNGVELVVGRRIIGAREFTRYYRQRPRPVDSQAVAVATAGVRERALVLAKAANMPSYRGPAVTRQQARVQRVEHRTTARLRMITEMNANGPQFRGFRE